MSLKKQALTGVFWSSLQLFGTQGIGLIVSVILARLLLPSEFGLIAMLGIFMGLAATLINIRILKSAYYIISEFKIQELKQYNKMGILLKTIK